MIRNGPRTRLISAPGPAKDLDELLADEREEPGASWPRRMRGLASGGRRSVGRPRPSGGRRSAPHPGARSRWSRATSAAKTSSKTGADLAARRRPRRRRSLMASTTSGVAVAASSTVSAGRAGRPGGRGGRPGRSASAMPSKRAAVSISIDVAAERLAAELVGRRQGDEPAAGDERDLVARLGLVDVLGRDEQRPALVAQPMELVPDSASQERVDARRRLVEEQQRRIVHERAGELEPALHAARQPARATAADVPQVDQLEDLAGPPPARAPEHPEQRGDEVDVLADGQVRVQGERLRHVADPLAGLAAEAARAPRPGPDLAARRAQGAGHHPDGRRLARAGRADDPEDGARRHGQRDAVDRELIRELDGRVVDHDGGVGGRTASRRRHWRPAPMAMPPDRSAFVAGLGSSRLGLHNGRRTGSRPDHPARRALARDRVGRSPLSQSHRSLQRDWHSAARSIRAGCERPGRTLRR